MGVRLIYLEATLFKRRVPENQSNLTPFLLGAALY